MPANLTTIRRVWGSRHFTTFTRLSNLPLTPEDRDILSSVGLPISPRDALHIEQAMQAVEIEHRRGNATLLANSTFKKTKHYPGTGHSQLDSQFDLSVFTVIGTMKVADGLGAGNVAHLCIAGRKRHIVAIDDTPDRGLTGYVRINSRLSRYIASLNAYRCWIRRTHGPRKHIQKHFSEFVKTLREIEPRLYNYLYWSYVAGLEQRRFMLDSGA